MGKGLIFGLEHKSRSPLFPALPLFELSRVRVVIANPAHIKQILSYKIPFREPSRPRRLDRQTAAHPFDFIRPYSFVASFLLLLYHQIFFSLNSHLLHYNYRKQLYFYLSH